MTRIDTLEKIAQVISSTLTESLSTDQRWEMEENLERVVGAIDSDSRSLQLSVLREMILYLVKD